MELSTMGILPMDPAYGKRENQPVGVGAKIATFQKFSF